MMRKKLKILLICNRPNTDANTIRDHIDSLSRHSAHEIFTLSHMGDFHDNFNLDHFDVIMIHYSIYLLGESYLTYLSKEKIRNFKGLKAQFIQDEYRHINSFIKTMNYLRLDILFTCVPEDQIEKVYPQAKLPQTRKINVLTGYVPDNLINKKTKPISERTIDVMYRSRKLSYWLGSLGVEKWAIADQFKEKTSQFNLKTDISYSEQDRIYGEKWNEFIGDSKTTLGVESGASVFDFDGTLQWKVENYCRKHPHATYGEVHKKFLTPYEGKIKLNQISPRCFETICLKSVQVLFEGDYSGILVPWRHYIPLKKDFSNIEDVVKKIKDDAYLQNMADVAYQEIILSQKYSYHAFVQKVDSVISEEVVLKKSSLSETNYRSDDFQRDLELHKLTKRKINMIYEYRHYKHFYGHKKALEVLRNLFLIHSLRALRRIARNPRLSFLRRLAVPILWPLVKFLRRHLPG